MKYEVAIPYSTDLIEIESERVAALLGLPTIRLTMRDQRVSLTPEIAVELGFALLSASSDHLH